jgi:hypothetical protein
MKETELDQVWAEIEKEFCAVQKCVERDLTVRFFVGGWVLSSARFTFVVFSRRSVSSRNFMTAM